MLKITITGDRAEGKTTLAKMIEKTLKSFEITFEKEYGKEDVIYN
jgi:deoxyadenosine/deoxycytidine kinase